MRILILLFLTMTGCKNKTIEEKRVENAVKSAYSINCVDVVDLNRCENHEVICYSKYGVESLSVQCKFKGENNARN